LLETEVGADGVDREATLGSDFKGVGGLLGAADFSGTRADGARHQRHSAAMKTNRSVFSISDGRGDSIVCGAHHGSVAFSEHPTAPKLSDIK
jgi:hypothetical protein